ncbi:hypothetical protein ACWJJH_02465 [Endozoicomonadaceae bacterium StTr2]
MKKLLTLAAIVIPAILSGCTSGVSHSTPEPKTDRVITSFSVSEYNSVDGRYHDRPTIVNVNDFGSSGRTVTIYSDNYGLKNGYITIDVTRIKDIKPFLHKFIKWAHIAKRDNDILNKPIGEYSYDFSLSGHRSYNFGFFTSKPQSFYLALDFKGSSTANFMISEHNVKQLIDTLEKVETGQYSQTDISKYN